MALRTHRNIFGKLVLCLTVFLATVHFSTFPARAVVSNVSTSTGGVGAAPNCSNGGGGFSVSFSADARTSYTFSANLYDGLGNLIGTGGGGGGGSAFGSGGGGGGFSFSNPSARPFTLVIYDAAFPSAAIGSVTFDPANSASGCSSLPFASRAGSQPRFTDGRVNNNEAGQTGAVYCTDGGVTIYHPNGKIGLVITKTQLDAFKSSHPLTGSQNALIKVQDGFKLYLLSDGNLQLVGPSLDGPGGSNYVFVWGGC